MSELRLSPSRASDFKKCPQLYKYRSVLKLDEPKTEPQAVGNLVHKVLEELMHLDAPDRNQDAASDLLVRHTQGERDEDWADLSDEGINKAKGMLRGYFDLEDPTKVRALELEWRVEAELPTGLKLRGIIDRRDEGNVLVDYKTGRVPSEKWEMQAFFGLRFYALVCKYGYDFVPRHVKLLYLAKGDMLSLPLEEPQVVGFGRQVAAIGKAIVRAKERDDFRPSPGSLCKVCSFVDMCPAWTGIDPPWKKKEDG